MTRFYRLYFNNNYTHKDFEEQVNTRQKQHQQEIKNLYITWILYLIEQQTDKHQLENKLKTYTKLEKSFKNSKNLQTKSEFIKQFNSKNSYLDKYLNKDLLDTLAFFDDSTLFYEEDGKTKYIDDSELFIEILKQASIEELQQIVQELDVEKVCEKNNTCKNEEKICKITSNEGKCNKNKD